MIGKLPEKDKCNGQQAVIGLSAKDIGSIIIPAGMKNMVDLKRRFKEASAFSIHSGDSDLGICKIDYN